MSIVARTINIEDIFIDNDFNSRGVFAPIDIADLAKSIEQSGLIQPITVEEWGEGGFKYRLVAGYRRTFAHKVLKKKTIDAVIKPHMTEVEALIFNLSENLSRKDLNVLQEAKALQRMRELGVPREKTAELLGQSSGWVQVRYYLLDLPEDIQNEAAAGYINQTGIREVHTAMTHRGLDAAYEVTRNLKERRITGKKTRILASCKDQKKETKRVRIRTEIFEMLEHILKSTGAGLATVAMSWCAGESTNEELYTAIKEEAELLGGHYIIPE